MLRSHRSLPLAIDSAVRYLGWGRGDALLMPSPVTPITGYCIGLEMPFSTGTTTVLLERWSAQDALGLIEQHRVVGTVGATPFLQELCEAVESRGGAALPIRVFACGGAAVPAALIARASRCFVGYACRVYGSTESPLITYGRRQQDVEVIGALTGGRINDYEVRIVDSDDRELALGAEGEILARGKGLLLGYANPDNTREAFTSDGFFRTGDIGIRAADDTLTITGRKKDLIIRGGENISVK
ncbi:MAG: AMP-binding protein [Panacagrimonas sp.]